MNRPRPSDGETNPLTDAANPAPSNERSHVSSSSSSHPPDESRQDWERVLWKRQPYPDNYIGPDFFRVTRTRLVVSRSDAMLGCMPVTREICSCLLLASVFSGLSRSLLQPWQVLTGTALYAAGGSYGSTLGVHVLHVCVLTVSLCGLLCGGPLQSLTASVSTDTVYACAALLLLLHVAMHQYGHSVAVANATLSHNVGVFACVCLASRLVGYWHVFAFSVAGIAVFARQEGEQEVSSPPSPHRAVLATGALLAVTTVLVWHCVPELLTLLLPAVLLANVAMPLLFVGLQGYRQNIYGPWDEARIDNR